MRFRPRMRPWMLVSAVWIAPAILATIDSVVQRRLNGEPPASTPELLFAGGDWLVYAILTPPIFAASRRWPIARPVAPRRALLHLAFALLFCVAWATVGKLLQLALGLLFRPADIPWQNLGRDWIGWIFTTLPFGVIVYLSIAAIAHAIRYFIEANEREIQMSRLSEQLAGTRLAALQARLNPHFLFNSLNTIAVLVRDGERTTATRVIEQLSDVLRRSLNRSEAPEIPLEEELALVRQYLAVEQARFSDRLRPVFAVDPAALRAAVPQFALQHLVENALRHGIAKRTEAGRVAVSARRDGAMLELIVEDDGPGADPAILRLAGHGLENTRERLRTLYGDRASLTFDSTPRGTVARLRLPYRELRLEPAT